MFNLNKSTKTKPKPRLIIMNCSYACVHHCAVCTATVHNTTQHSSTNFSSYPSEGKGGPEVSSLHEGLVINK